MSDQKSRRLCRHPTVQVCIGALLAAAHGASAQCPELSVLHGTVAYDVDASNPFGGGRTTGSLTADTRSATVTCDGTSPGSAGYQLPDQGPSQENPIGQASDAIQVPCSSAGVWTFPQVAGVQTTSDTLCVSKAGTCPSLSPADSGGANAGVFSYSDSLNDGSTATLRCNTGFVLRDPAALHRVCTGGLWAAEQADTAAQVCDPQSLAAPWLQPHLPDSADCPIGDFRAKLTAVDEACCAGGQCVAQGVTECSVQCGGKFLALYSTCNATMTQLLDGVDGELDGVAAVVEDLRTRCLAIPVTDIIAELIRMRNEDSCTIDGDGIGEQQVHVRAPGECIDSGGDTLCGLISAGVLTCESDFCPECAHAHKCDVSCGFDCSSNGGSAGGKHRRTQGIHLSNVCSALNLGEKVGPVNTACCDEGRQDVCTGGGDAGVPTVCDVKCAMEYAPFYDECERALRTAFSAVSHSTRRRDQPFQPLSSSRTSSLSEL